jgi:hypothetical protein
VGGLDAVTPISAMPATHAVLAYNLIASEYGLRCRLGSREWCTGLTGSGVNEVRSVLPFTGTTTAKNRLFACTNTGIWDVSSSDTSPTQVLTFAASTGDAGYGVCTVFVTSAGHFLLYADEVNGLHYYTESSDTWAAVAMGGGATQISGVDPANIRFVTAWKNKVLLVEKDSTKAWYLASGTIYGAATSFNLAQRFRAGGTLRGLWSWTYDGGAGIDDALVALSDGGDVAVYLGTDFVAGSIALKGVWYVGAPPAGRKVATNFGGDLLLLSRTGIVPLSKLVLGGDMDRSQYVTAKVANLFNAAMLSKASYKQWSMVLHPEDNALMVTVPTSDTTATEQLVMSLTTRSWTRYRDLGVFSAESWGGKLYYGTVDGKVCINDGYVDGVTLADPNSYSPVYWSGLQAFSNLGNGLNKQVQSLRPVLLCESTAPSFAVAARYDYNLTEAGQPSAASDSAALWDSAAWDSALWGGEYAPTQQLRGATGMGRSVAVAIRGTAIARTVWVGTDILFTQGGPL